MVQNGSYILEPLMSGMEVTHGGTRALLDPKCMISTVRVCYLNCYSKSGEHGKHGKHGKVVVDGVIPLRCRKLQQFQ